METKIRIVFVASLTGIIVILYILTNSQPKHLTKHGSKFGTGSQGIHYILYWTKMFGVEDFELGFGQEIFGKCRVNNCFATSKKDLISVENFSAIIFHGREYNENRHGKPSKRIRSQIYVYGNLETPIYTSRSFLYPKGFFNWTMTYR